jgi:hypothetical protein
MLYVCVVALSYTSCKPSNLNAFRYDCKRSEQGISKESLDFA